MPSKSSNLLTDMNSFPGHRGVVVPLVTPVTNSGQLDEPAAERLVEHVASNGCGMLVLGTTGEVASLPATLRRRYVEIAVRVAAKRTPVFACIAANCLADSVDAAADYLRSGADAVVGMLPNYFKLEPADMQAYFEQLSAGIRGPLLVYNMPQTTGMSLPVEIIEQLSRCPNITGLKDSENTPGRCELVAERLGGRQDFSLFMGVAASSIPALRLGFVGLVPSSGNLYPERWHELYNAAQAGNWARAEQLQQQLDSIGAVFQRNRTLGQSLAALKAGVGLRKLCGPAMVPPLTALDDAGCTAVRDELIRLG
jgi:2-dehydro-3-deoxy-D-pentonate aldolase